MIHVVFMRPDGGGSKFFLDCSFYKSPTRESSYQQDPDHPRVLSMTKSWHYGRKIPVKKFIVPSSQGFVVCVQAHPARMTAGLSPEIPGHGSSICPGPISGSMMHTANSTTYPSGGGARPAMHSGMRCGEPWEHPLTCPFCSPPPGVIVAKNTVCYARRHRYPRDTCW
jgi:hypothetical protein